MYKAIVNLLYQFLTPRKKISLIQLNENVEYFLIELTKYDIYENVYLNLMKRCIEPE